MRVRVRVRKRVRVRGGKHAHGGVLREDRQTLLKIVTHSSKYTVTLLLLLPTRKKAIGKSTLHYTSRYHQGRGS